MAVIGINYDGGNEYGENGDVVSNHMKYNSVYLYINEEEEFVFASGDFIKDWYNAKKKYGEFIDKEPFLSQSSSCNHFQSDGGHFDCAYLHVINEKPVLKYVDTTEPDWVFSQRDVFENGWKFFVKEGEKQTWEELKEYCTK
jgi:hypothetical protein